MNLRMPAALADEYRSPAQRARVVTEAWAEVNLFCPACPSPELRALPANTRAGDFVCPRCAQPFQLKGKSSPFSDKVVDGAFTALVAAVQSDAAPNLFLLQYERSRWTVTRLTLVPGFAFPVSAIEKRKPLSTDARRAGWIGCSIVLSRIPTDARIVIVNNGNVESAARIRAAYARIAPLKSVAPAERGWTLDVLRVVREFGSREFTNAEMYARAAYLQQLHPRNRHVTQKIRQQLQVLRDHGLLEHTSRGRWRETGAR